MIYDAIERTITIVDANFTTDLQALVAAKGVTGVYTDVKVYGRRRAQQFWELMEKDGVDAGIGIYPQQFDTPAEFVMRRHSRHQIVIEYYAVGKDPDALAVQMELAAEAILRSIDRLIVAGGSSGIIAVGEEDGDIIGEWVGASWNDELRLTEDNLQIRFVCIARDELT